MAHPESHTSGHLRYEGGARALPATASVWGLPAKRSWLKRPGFVWSSSVPDGMGVQHADLFLGWTGHTVCVAQQQTD